MTDLPDSDHLTSKITKKGTLEKNKKKENPTRVNKEANKGRNKRASKRLITQANKRTNKLGLSWAKLNFSSVRVVDEV